MNVRVVECIDHRRQARSSATAALGWHLLPPKRPTASQPLPPAPQIPRLTSLLQLGLGRLGQHRRPLGLLPWRQRRVVTLGRRAPLARLRPNRRLIAVRLRFHTEKSLAEDTMLGFRTQESLGITELARMAWVGVRATRSSPAAAPPRPSRRQCFWSDTPACPPSPIRASRKVPARGCSTSAQPARLAPAATCAAASGAVAS